MKLVPVKLDGIRKKCEKCLATHGYWLGGKCQICVMHKETARLNRFGKHPLGKLPDFSDRNVAEQN